MTMYVVCDVAHMFLCALNIQIWTKCEITVSKHINLMGTLFVKGIFEVIFCYGSGDFHYNLYCLTYIFFNRNNSSLNSS